MNSDDLQTSFSAADTSIGFDYQYYYFFYQLLGLSHGQTIGLEVKDDIHIDLPDKTAVLIQTKHSVQTNADGNVINLTELGHDLWKTISNWSKVINAESNKKEFLDKHLFVLVTNKNNKSNPFLDQLKSFQISKGITDFKKYLRELKSSTSDTQVKSWIDDLISLKEYLASFLSKIKIDLNQDDLINRIKARILEKICDRGKVEDIYACIDSQLRTINYLETKNSKPIIITFDEFSKKFGGCFKKGLSTKLPIRELPFILPSKIEEQLFIRQLFDIADISASEKERIIELTTCMLKYYNNLRYWETEDGLLQAQKEAFLKNSKILWNNKFTSVYRLIKRKITEGENLEDLEAEIKIAALECLDEMRKQVLTIDETQLDLELSNGHFYARTEDKEIGWHYLWEIRYK
jgi:hypothetical protein